MTLLTARYAEQIAGVVSCYDRIVIMGTLPGVCYAAGMAAYLRSHGLRLFDYPHFAERLREEIRQNAERLAQEHGLAIEFLRSVHAFGKEDRLRAILTTRGEQPGLVPIFAALDPCAACTPWHAKESGKTTLRDKDGTCLHYYCDFIDEEVGLCSLRVPTWAPVRLQFSCTGHNWLAGPLRQAGIACETLDKTFRTLGDSARAQTRAAAVPVTRLHPTRAALAARYCPVLAHVGTTYHWSLLHVAYATASIFRRQEDLRPLSESLVRTAVHAVTPDNVAPFLGRKRSGHYADELGNDFPTRIEGARLKHHRGPVAITLSDTQALVLRSETTVNDVSFLRHHRRGEHRDGTTETQLAPMQRTIDSLAPVRELRSAANRRYRAFLSDLAHPTAGVQQVERLAAPVRHEERTYRGCTLFNAEDLALCGALARGEWPSSGVRNATLRRVLPERTGPQVARLLKRLHLHGLVRKIGPTDKYSLTPAGQHVALTALKLRELVVIPSLAGLVPNQP